MDNKSTTKIDPYDSPVMPEACTVGIAVYISFLKQILSKPGQPSSAKVCCRV